MVSSLSSNRQASIVGNNQFSNAMNATRRRFPNPTHYRFWAESENVF